MKIIAPRPHGFIDYAAIVVLFLAPALLGFEGTPEAVCYVVAALYLAMCLMTAYPLGAIKTLPFAAHGTVEVVLALAFAAMPWLLGFADLDHARNFFLIAAGALGLTWLLTDYHAATDPASRGEQRASHA